MKIDVSFWNYTRLSRHFTRPRDAVAEWRSLGVTVGFSFRYDPGQDSLCDMIELIEECGRQGLKLIVYDARVYLPAAEGALDEAAYVSLARAAAQDFGKYPQVAGFYLGDEPTKAQFPRFLRAAQILASVTDKPAFMNFSWCDAHLKDFSGREEYAEYLVRFAKEAGLRLISNDRYSCLHAKDYEPGFRETGIDKYFADLNLFRGAASACGVPYWTSLCAVGHWVYRTPSEADIRWQINTAVAHGAQGVQWFFLYQHRYADDYYSYPVDIYGARSETFGHIARHCRTLNDHTAAALGNAHFSKVWHTGKSYGGTPLLRQGDAEVFIRSDHGQSGILSEFCSGQNKRYLLVNSDQEYGELYYIEQGGRELYHIWLPAGGAHVIGR